jgi:hypothetical protein
VTFGPSASLDGLGRRPWLAASLLLHALVLIALALAAPLTVLPDGARRISTPQEAQRVSASLEQARRQQMQRQVRELERVQREMAGEPPAAADAPLPSDPAALRERARQLSERIHAASQQRRAEELARLLKIPPAEALKRVQADPRHAPPAAQASVTELTQDAQARLMVKRLQEHASQQGRPAQASAGEPGAAGAGGGAGSLNSGGSGAGGGSGSGRAAGGLAGGQGEPQDLRRYGTLVGSRALDPAELRLGAGQRIGPGAPLATRVLLDRWYLTGPFDGRSPSMLQHPYPPELAVDLDAVYEGKDGRLLIWQIFKPRTYPLVPEPRHANAVYYAATELHSDRERDVWLELGVDDDAKLWLNDELVWTSSPIADKPWYRAPFYNLSERLAQQNLVEARVPVRLQQGPNRLLLKLYNGVDLTFFSVHVSP